MPFTPLQTNKTGFTKFDASTVSTNKPVAPVSNAQKGASEALNMPKNIAPAIGGSIKSAFNSGVDTMKSGYSSAKDAANKGDLLGLVEGSVKSAAGGFGALLSPLAPAGDVVNDTIVKPASDVISNIPAVQKFASSKAGEVTSRVVEDVNNLNTIFGSVAGVMDLAPKLKTEVPKVPGQIADKITGKIDKIKEVSKGKPGDPNVLAGKIIQGETVDKAPAAASLSKIDFSNVKTYEDLSKTFKDKLESTHADLNTELGKNKTVTKLGDLSLKETVGGKTVAHNYVKDAINQLKDHYATTNDVPALAKIKQLETLANTKGLTVRQLNDLAIEQGTEIDAYKRNGDLASSNKAQAAENTRTGVKSTARKIYGSDSYSALDKQYSQIKNTADLVDKMTETVNKAKQKAQTIGLGTKIGQMIMKVVDLTTGGLLKGAVKELVGKNVGSSLSPLELEKALTKNLKKFQEAISAKTEAEMTKKLEALTVDPSTTPPEVLTGKIKPYIAPENTIAGSIPVKNAPKGNYLNIGMKVGTTDEPITVAQIKSALPKDVKILNSKIVKGDENTFVPQLSRPLTETEMNNLLKATKQKAIPQLSNGEGKMHGSNEWGEFNPEYFYGKDGKPLSVKLKGKLKP